MWNQKMTFKRSDEWKAANIYSMEISRQEL